MHKVSVVIVSPALADANNGNWQTARRWQQMLASDHRTRIVRAWPDAGATAQDAVMIALHARRSASSAAAWAAAHPGRGLVVVLTGTDLYRDIQTDLAAQRRGQFVWALLLQHHQALRGKVRVIFQSSPARQSLPKTGQHLRAVMVGHLREEKSPRTLMEAASLLRGDAGILIDHIGAALDPLLEQAATATAASYPNYRWLGGLQHEVVRRRIQRAHVLVHTSRMEGGAHVIMEAVTSGTPVLASRVAGNVGMLGEDYAGYFTHGDATALADLLRRCAAQADGAGAGTPSAYLRQLTAQCARRAALFAPACEQRSLHQLIQDILDRP